MGMSIEDIEQWARQNNCMIVSNNWWEAAQDTINKYQKLQADCYENRLKADLAVILAQIQFEIEGKKFLESSCSFMDKTEEKNYAVYMDDISKVIQQKIDKLKENKNENEKN